MIDVGAGDPRHAAGLELPIVAEAGSAAALLSEAGVSQVVHLPPPSFFQLLLT